MGGKMLWALTTALAAGACTPPSVGGMLMSAAVPSTGNVVVVQDDQWRIPEVRNGTLVQPVSSVAPEVTLSCEPAERCDHIYIFDDGRFAIELEGRGPFVLRVERPGFAPVETTIERDQTYLLVLLPVRPQGALT